MKFATVLAVFALCMCATSVYAAYDECDACLELFQFWVNHPDLTPVSEVTPNYCTSDFATKNVNATARDFHMCDTTFKHLTRDVESRSKMNHYLMNGCGAVPCPPEKSCELLQDRHQRPFCRA